MQVSCWIILLHLITLGVSDASINKTHLPSCIPAQPPVNPSILSQNCFPYQYKSTGYCRHIIKWKVNSNPYEQEKSKESLKQFKSGIFMLEFFSDQKIRKSCLIPLNDVICKYYYPKCDLTTNTLRSQPVCRETCENVLHLCNKELIMAKQLLQQASNLFLNCTLLPKRNGGHTPECYYNRNLSTETDKLKSSECYYGNGLGYHGNVNVTRSGHVCQSWSSQCPHRHNHSLAEYPELVDASNWCRNPGGQAPNGPWCYTTDKNIRWEYCNVKKCLDSAPRKTALPSCIPAQPPVNPSILSQNCFPYQYKSTGYCRHIIKWKVNIIPDEQKKRTDSMMRFDVGKNLLEKAYKQKIRKSCLIPLSDIMCKFYYPKCDLTTNTLRSQPICRETCENVLHLCNKESIMAKKANELLKQAGYPFFWDILNCTLLPKRNGGDSPECYYSNKLNTETDKLKSSECYYGNGLGYQGNVSVTRSGLVCQSWSSQCPHRHNHSLAEYPELVDASNWCRNPGGQSPNGPWCYTNDKNIRWEYCNVKKCPDPAPSLSPVILTALSTGPYKIILGWTAVPLPFVHGTPFGFRIRVKKVGDNDVIVNTTSANATYFEAENLHPLTKYNVSVLEFNENGDGPWSAARSVTTKPKHFVAIRLTLILKEKKFGPALLNRNETRYQKLEEEIKSKLKKLLQNTKSLGYNIFDITILRFFNGSVGAELDVTVELVNATSRSATQSITGKILEGAHLRASRGLAFSSLNVKASPPPPVNLSQSDVTRTSAAISWSAPDHHGPFRITNYTIKYKKAGTRMGYYNAMIVGANESKTVVNNLDANIMYMMRVSSVNEYGVQPSEPITVTTKANPETTSPHQGNEIIIIVVVMAVVLVVIIIVFLKWWSKKRQDEKQLKERIERLWEDPYGSSVDWFKLFKIDVMIKWWEIPRDQLTLEQQVGSGAFGVVSKGFVKKIDEDGREQGFHCAVKMLKEYPSERQLLDFCKEIKTMSSIDDHPNIVSLIGACTIDGPPMLVVKFAPNGCLIDYIKENRPLPEYENAPHELPFRVITEKERFKFAYEIAQGMAHLEKHRYVHRDLAARNILLGKNMVAMVSDFGLSRDIYERGAYEHTEGGILPVRWMAPESLKDFTYNSTTDVWSYGVLLWEMASGADVPYGGLQGLEILDYLRQGYRLQKPCDTSCDMYSLMWRCWNPDPKQRPKFSDLVYQVGGIVALVGDNKETVVNVCRGNMNETLEDEHNNENRIGEAVSLNKNIIELKDIKTE